MLERLRRLAGVDSTTVYECQDCGARFEVQRQVCTECGGYHIDRPEW